MRERVALLENVSDHNTFSTLLSMPEFGFLNKNPKLESRLYKSRLDRYFSRYESFYEENTSWKEIYDRLVMFQTKSDLKILPLLRKLLTEGKLMELKILLHKTKLYKRCNSGIAATNGHLHMLKWMKENNIEMPDQEAINLTAEYNHLDTLKWLKENNLGQPDQSGANWAAARDNLEVLKWMKENNLSMSDVYGIYLARANSCYKVLKWLDEQ